MEFKRFVMGYNPILCDFILILVIWYSRTYFMLCRFFCYSCVLVFYVMGLGSCILLFLGEFFWITKIIWMWCTIHDISMLCVVNVVTMMVISANIGTHDKWLCFRLAFTITLSFIDDLVLGLESNLCLCSLRMWFQVFKLLVALEICLL
jgi:hypothetical protein